jgi:hypothetical protein
MFNWTFPVTAHNIGMSDDKIRKKKNEMQVIKKNISLGVLLSSIDYYYPNELSI